MLQSLTRFTQNVPILSVDNDTNGTTNATNRFVIALRNFGLVLRDVPIDDFSGEVFSVDLGPVREAIRMNGTIDEDSLLAVTVPNATASLRVPASAFDMNDGDVSSQNDSDTSNQTDSSVETRRLVFSVFLMNSLFIENETNCDKFSIGSIIASVDFDTTNYNLSNESIQVTLQEYREVYYIIVKC